MLNVRDINNVSAYFGEPHHFTRTVVCVTVHARVLSVLLPVPMNARYVRYDARLGLHIVRWEPDTSKVLPAGKVLSLCGTSGEASSSCTSAQRRANAFAHIQPHVKRVLHWAAAGGQARDALLAAAQHVLAGIVG